jgi:hypothetical protein
MWLIVFCQSCFTHITHIHVVTEYLGTECLNLIVNWRILGVTGGIRVSHVAIYK